MIKNIIIWICVALVLFLYWEVNSLNKEISRVESEIHRYLDPVRTKAVQNSFDIQNLQRTYY